MNRDSKKLIAAAAALQILLYHCWIPVFRYGTTAGSIERFLVAATYPAVDMYFFISAYSLVSRPVDDYRSFIKNRAVKLLPMFFIALIAGSFMWFIPTIMAMYLIIPPLQKIFRGDTVSASFLLITVWIAAVYVVLGVVQPDSDLGIVLFRIPGMMLGAWAAKSGKKLTTRQAVFSGTLLIAAGMLLIYRFGYINRLNVPFRNVFYLTGIPVMLGTIILLDLTAEKGIPAFIERFGSMTLELYFSQMVFGTLLIDLLFRVTDSRMLVNLMTIAALITVSAIIKKINDSLLHFFS